MAYITEKRLVRVEQVVTTGAVCDCCLASLAAIDDPNHHLFSGSLSLVLVGGYGQYFDDQDVRVLICKECADKMIKAFPFLGVAMDQQATW